MIKHRERMATVLLVEDDPGDQALTQRAFEAGKLHVDLRIAQDGEEALDYLKRRGRFDELNAPRPDLILLDINLPKLDGKGVLQRMRADAELRRIPVVALTTSKHEEDVIKSYELGVNSYIAKPMDIDQFTVILRELGDYWFKIVLLPPSES